MKKVLIALMMVMSLNVYALDSKDIAYAGFSDLTTQEQAEIVKLVADKKAKKLLINTSVNVDNAQKWVNLGSSIGKGLAASSKELGIAVNDFSKSDVGKWTMFLIIFKIIGANIIHFIGGLIFLIVGVTVTTMLFNRKYPWSYTYLDGKIESKQRKSTDSADMGPWYFAYLIIVGIGVLIMVLA